MCVASKESRKMCIMKKVYMDLKKLFFFCNKLILFVLFYLLLFEYVLVWEELTREAHWDVAECSLCSEFGLPRCILVAWAPVEELLSWMWQPAGPGSTRSSDQLPVSLCNPKQAFPSPWTLKIGWSPNLRESCEEWPIFMSTNAT